MINNGHILAILKRHKAIRAAMVIENANKYDKSKMNKRIAVIQGDITQQRVDAIVNAANNSLLGGGGVDGAIHKAAGPELLKECRQLNGCATGEAKITKGYNLLAKWVVHTVGPIWYGGNQGEDELLASCYRNCLAIAEQEQYQIKTIAFSAISTGVYGFPVERAARIAASEIQRFLETNNSLEQVILVCFSKSAYEDYLSAVKQMSERQLD
jgi:O-acetyl-ADP-ribose deacetylase (regulator of RNase III)